MIIKVPSEVGLKENIKIANPLLVNGFRRKVRVGWSYSYTCLNDALLFGFFDFIWLSRKHKKARKHLILQAFEQFGIL